MSKQKSLLKVAKKLQVNPTWLDNLIYFESKWNIKAKNPLSSAKGLIQFTDSTSRSLGYKNSQDLIDKNNTLKKQLEKPVYNYLKQYMPFPTKQSLYMSVFYPKARNVNPETVFPQNVRDVNPGIIKVKDYVNKVDGIKTKEALKIFPLLLAGIGFYIYSQKRKR